MYGKNTKTLSRRAQGEQTRATLIDTGARLFAQHGYAAVSMRTLAAEAAVNLATISYHFGGKAGLYEAIIEEIIEVRDDIFPTAEEVTERMDAAGESLHAKGEVVEWFTSQLVREIVGQVEYVWPTVIISRELAHPSALYPKLEKEFFTPSFVSLCTLVERALPDTASREDVAISAHCIIGMVVKLLEGHTLITKRLGWDSYEAHIETITTILSKRTRGFLGLPMETV